MAFLRFSPYWKHLFRREGLRTGAAPLRQNASDAFSLLEILLVTGIILVMTLISLMSLPSLKTASSLTAGGNNLADLAQLARDYALSHNVITAFVGVTNSTLTNASYRAFIVLSRDSSGNWAPVTQWTWLPSATVMSSAETNSFLTYQGSNPQTFTNSSSSALVLNRVNVNDGCAYQLFFPDGQIDSVSSSTFVLRLVSASPASDQAAANPRNWYDLVFIPSTGAIKIERP